MIVVLFGQVPLVMEGSQLHHDPICRMPIPQFDLLSFTYIAARDLLDFLFQIIQLTQLVRSMSDSDRPLRIFPDRQAGDAKIGGFFLNTSGVG